MDLETFLKSFIEIKENAEVYVTLKKEYQLIKMECLWEVAVRTKSDVCNSDDTVCIVRGKFKRINEKTFYLTLVDDEGYLIKISPEWIENYQVVRKV